MQLFYIVFKLKKYSLHLTNRNSTPKFAANNTRRPGNSAPPGAGTKNPGLTGRSFVGKRKCRKE
jgi:hypothetical protein